MRYLKYIVAALLVLWLFTGVTQVDSTQRAVIRRFGRVLDYQPGPGLYVGFPWGIERVERVSMLERSVKVGFEPGVATDPEQAPPGQVLTGDHNLVNLQMKIAYSVQEDQIADFVMHGEQRVEAFLVRTTEAILTEWVAGRPVDEVLRQQGLASRVLALRIQECLAPYRLGIEVRAASVTHLAPPDEVKKSFEDVAQAHAEIDTRKNEADQTARRLSDKAAADALRTTRLATAYGQKLVLLAEAEAGNFTKRSEQYQQALKTNPQYLTALWWDEMSKLYERMRQNGRIDLLDNRLSADGLDITQFPPLPRKK